MSRLADVFLQGAYAQGRAPMTDLKYGAQNGMGPNLAEWVSNQAYISRQMVVIAMEYPKGFDYLPNSAAWKFAYKQLIEVHAKSVTGFSSGLEVDTAETNVSGGGEMQMDPTNVKRQRTEPVFTWIDKYGRPIQNFLHDWITMLIMDPDSKVPGITTLPGIQLRDLLADIYGGTILAYEPDPTGTIAAKAWLSTNFYPLMTGDITGKRALTDPGEQSELSIKFSAVTQTGAGPLALAQSIIDRVNFTNANPNLRPAFQSTISPGLEAPAYGAQGWREQVAHFGNTAILRP